MKTGIHPSTIRNYAGNIYHQLRRNPHYEYSISELFQILNSERSVRSRISAKLSLRFGLQFQLALNDLISRNKIRISSVVIDNILPIQEISGRYEVKIKAT